VVVRDLAKVEARVRFPYPAPVLAVFRRLRTTVQFSRTVLESLPQPMLAYLCGRMEFAEDGGRLWRRKLTPFLREQLGHRVYDPAEDEKKNLTDEESTHFREWKTADLERFRRVIRKIIAFDLDLIENKADYVICFWESAASQSGGTPAELTVAHRKGIPVYLVTSLPVEQVSGWMLGCSDQVFTSIESLKEFLSARFSREKQTQLWKD
jgi:hypothetical protein